VLLFQNYPESALCLFEGSLPSGISAEPENVFTRGDCVNKDFYPSSRDLVQDLFRFYHRLRAGKSARVNCFILHDPLLLIHPVHEQSAYSKAEDQAYDSSGNAECSYTRP